MKIVKFESKRDKLNKDLQDLIECKDLENALVMCACEKGVHLIDYECEIEDLKFYRQLLDDRIRKIEVRKIVNDYLGIEME